MFMKLFGADVVTLETSRCVNSHVDEQKRKERRILPCLMMR